MTSHAASDVERDLIRQTGAARDLMAQLRDAGAEDDAELVADSIQGETSLPEAMEAAMSEIDDLDALELGIEAVNQRNDTRLAAIRARRDRIRASMEQAMVAVDQQTLRLPTATITVAKRPPQIVIVNESEIPARFWKQPDPPAPKLDKKALALALKANEIVPGATLDNGTVSLTIRRN